MNATLEFTLESLASDIDGLYDLNAELEVNRKLQAHLAEPERPVIITSNEEWDAYCRALDEYEEEKRNFRRAVDETLARIESAKTCLRQQLPGNIWFEVMTKRGIRWVGNETSSWPGDRGTLYIQDTKPTEPLKHRIVND
jgi:PHD/YefM family antitoxin component YafN of YafNO toxin-antitoxin module